MFRTNFSHSDEVNWWGDARTTAALRATSEGSTGVLAGLISTADPRDDEWCFANGIDSDSILNWTNTAATDDALFQLARTSGAEKGPALRSGLQLSGRRHEGDTHLLWVATPESLDGNQRWCAAFLRNGAPFSREEQQRCTASVRLWQASFNMPNEQGLSYLLAGTAHRLLRMDPGCELRLLDAKADPAAFLQEISAICQQRWPEAPCGETHDIAIPLGDQNIWITIRTFPPAFEGAKPQTLYELRPLEDSELPAVGLIDDERIAQSIGYLHDHYHKSPSLSGLAAQVGISPFHFHRLFARHVGISPKQYQLLKQLQTAKWHLRCTGDPIGSIAERVGFANHAHFTATFRRVLGISPTEYRTQTLTCC